MAERIVDPPIDPDSKHTSVWRSLDRSLAGHGVTVLRSPYEFSKKTPGVARGVDYLLEDRKMLDLIKSTRADVRDILVPLEILDTEPDVADTHHGKETVSLAREGRTRVRQALERGDRIVNIRGAHDAYDVAGALEAFDGDVGLIIVDAHLDGHSPDTSISGSPHGMWVKTMLGGAGDLDRIMENCPKLKPENIIYIGTNQPDGPDEEKFIEDLAAAGAKVFTVHDMTAAGGMGDIFQAIDDLQRRVPIWMELDEDGLIDAAASMPGGGVREQQIKEIATRVGSNQLLKDMQQVVGIAVSEFQAPDDNASDAVIEQAERQAETVKAVVYRALGAGYHEDSQDLGTELEGESQELRELRQEPASALATRRRRRTIKQWTIGALIATLGTLGIFGIANQAKKIKKQEEKIERLEKQNRSGLPRESVWVPILDGTWRANVNHSAIKLFEDSQFFNLANRLATKHDGATGLYIQRSMHTILQAALLKAGNDQAVREQLRQRAFGSIPAQYREHFATQADAYEHGPEIEELRKWMQLHQFLEPETSQE